MIDIAQLAIRVEALEVRNATRDLENMGRAGGQAAQGVDRVSEAARAATASLKSLVAAYLGLQSAKQIIMLADSMTMLEARIKIATSSVNDYKVAMEQLRTISTQTGTSLEANATMFTRLNKAVESIGGSASTTLGLTKTLAEALKVSGASASETSSLIVQLSQALSSGVLRGDEFNSVMENGSRVVDALSAATGKSRGELRKLAEEGKLSTEVVVAALQNQASAISQDFSKIPLTISASLENVQTAFSTYIANLNSSLGTTGAIANTINGIAVNLAQTIEGVKFAFEAIAAVILSRTLPALIAYVQAKLSAIAIERAHAAAIIMDLERTVAITSARAAQTAAELAAAQATLAGTTAMGARMAAMDAVNVATTANIAATNAATTAQQALTAATASSTVTLTGMAGMLNIVNIAMAGFLGMQFGNFLNGFESVRSVAVTTLSGMLYMVNDVSAAFQKLFAIMTLNRGAVAGIEAGRAKEEDKIYSIIKDMQSTYVKNGAASNTALPQATAQTADFTKKLNESLSAIKTNTGAVEKHKAAHKGLSEAQKAANQFAQEGKQLAESLLTPAQQYNVEIDKLSKHLKAGHISQDQFNLGLDNAAKKLLDATKATEYMNKLEQEAEQYRLKGRDALQVYREELEKLVAVYNSPANRNGSLMSPETLGANASQLGDTLNDSLKNTQQNKALADYNKLLDDTISKTNDLGATNQGVFDGALGGINLLVGALSSMGDALAKNTQQQQALNDAYAAASAQPLTKSERIELNNKHLKASIDLEKQRVRAEVNGARQAAAAAASMFKEKSAARKAFNVIETTLTALEVAQAVQASAQAIMASQAEGTAKAGVAVANQGSGDPYTAFARIAAMIALMASIGYAVGGGGSSVNLAQSRQEATGTGTVLGDPKAKSESISKAIERLKENSDLTMPISQGMLAALNAIRDSLVNLGLALTKSIGITGLNTDASSKLGYSTLFGGGDSAFMGALAGSPLGFKKSLADAGITFQPTDEDPIPQTLGEILAGQKVWMQTYNDITKTMQLFGLSLGKGSTSRYRYDIDPEIQKMFGKAYTEAASYVRLIADNLGQAQQVTNELINAYSIEPPDLSLKDLTGDELQKAVDTWWSAEMDKLSSAVLESTGVEAFQRLGEGMAETASRVINGVEAANNALDRFGIKAIGYRDILNKQGDVGLEIFKQSVSAFEVTSEGLTTAVGKIIRGFDGSVQEAADLYRQLIRIRTDLSYAGVNSSNLSEYTIQGAGSLDALSKGSEVLGTLGLDKMQQYYNMQRTLREEFQRLNTYLPYSVDAFKGMIRGINTSTEAGQKLQGALIALAPAMETLFSLEKEAFDDQQSRINALNSLQDEVDSQLAKIERSTAANALADINKQIDAIIEKAKENGGSVQNIESLRMAKIRDQVKDVVAEFSNLGKTDYQKSLSGITQWADELAALAPTYAKAFNIAETEVLHVIDRIKSARLEALNKERQQVIENASASFTRRNFSELGNQLASIYDRAVADISTLLASGGDYVQMLGLAQQHAITMYEAQQKAASAIRATFIEIFNSIHDRRADIQDSILSLSGGSTAAINERQRQRALMDLQSGNYQRQMDAVSRLQSLTMDNYQRQLDMVKNIKTYLNNLALSDLSPLSNQQRLDEARRQAFAQFDKAKAGDSDALANITQYADAYLKEAKSFYASSPEYAAIYAQVTGGLNELIGGAATKTLEEYQLDAQQAAVTQLQSIDATLVNILEQQRLQQDSELTATLTDVDKGMEALMGWLTQVSLAAFGVSPTEDDVLPEDYLSPGKTLNALTKQYTEALETYVLAGILSIEAATALDTQTQALASSLIGYIRKGFISQSSGRMVLAAVAELNKGVIDLIEAGLVPEAALGVTSTARADFIRSTLKALEVGSINETQFDSILAMRYDLEKSIILALAKGAIPPEIADLFYKDSEAISDAWLEAFKNGKITPEVTEQIEEQRKAFEADMMRVTEAAALLGSNSVTFLSATANAVSDLVIPEDKAEEINTNAWAVLDKIAELVKGQILPNTAGKQLGDAQADFIKAILDLLKNNHVTTTQADLVYNSVNALLTSVTTAFADSHFTNEQSSSITDSISTFTGNITQALAIQHLSTADKDLVAAAFTTLSTQLQTDIASAKLSEAQKTVIVDGYSSLSSNLAGLLAQTNLSSTDITGITTGITNMSTALQTSVQKFNLSPADITLLTSGLTTLSTNTANVLAAANMSPDDIALISYGFGAAANNVNLDVSAMALSEPQKALIKAGMTLFSDGVKSDVAAEQLGQDNVDAIQSGVTTMASNIKSKLAEQTWLSGSAGTPGWIVGEGLNQFANNVKAALAAAPMPSFSGGSSGGSSGGVVSSNPVTITRREVDASNWQQYIAKYSDLHHLNTFALAKAHWDNYGRAEGRTFAKGGFYPGGLALVGEEGPELINFDRPGQVYTAPQTRELFNSQQDNKETVAAIKETTQAIIQSIKANAKGQEALQKELREAKAEIELLNRRIERMNSEAA